MAQTETVLNLLPGGKKLVAVKVESPTLVSGKVSATLGSINKIDYVIGSIQTPALIDTKVMEMTYAIGANPNQIDATLKLGTTTAWAAATTEDAATTALSFLVIGA